MDNKKSVKKNLKVGFYKDGKKKELDVKRKSVKEELNIKTGLGIDGTHARKVICAFCGAEYDASMDPPCCYACNGTEYVPYLNVDKSDMKVGSIPSGNKFDTSTRPIPFDKPSKFAVIPVGGVKNQGIPDNTRDVVVKNNDATPFSMAGTSSAIPVGGVSRYESKNGKKNSLRESDELVNRKISVSFSVNIPIMGEVILGSDGSVEAISETTQNVIDSIKSDLETCELTDKDYEIMSVEANMDTISLLESVKKKRCICEESEEEGEEFDDKGEVERFGGIDSEETHEESEEESEESEEKEENEEEEIEEPVKNIVVVNKEQFEKVIDELDIEENKDVDKEELMKEAEEMFEKGEWIAFDCKYFVIVEGPSDDKEDLVASLQDTEEEEGREERSEESEEESADEEDSKEEKKSSKKAKKVKEDEEDSDTMSEIPGDIVK